MAASASQPRYADPRARLKIPEFVAGTHGLDHADHLVAGNDGDAHVRQFAVPLQAASHLSG